MKFHETMPETDLSSFAGKALEPIEAVAKELTKLSVMVNVLWSTFSPEDQQVLWAEYNRRLSAVHLSPQRDSDKDS
jgi:hypothetical protein